MSVIIDQSSLATEQLGLSTVGQLLAHLRQDDRLVVNLLIDGLEPDLAQLGDIRRSPLIGHTIFIETARAQDAAIAVLDDVQAELNSADEARSEAVELLQQNQIAPAMEKLAGCFAAWHTAQQSVLKTSQLLEVDIEKLQVGGQSLPMFLSNFTAQLHQIKNALVNRDYVLLSDMLQYETTETSRQWQAVLTTLRAAAQHRTVEESTPGTRGQNGA